MHGSGDAMSSGVTLTSRSQTFTHSLLAAVLSSSPDAVSTVMHAVNWGHPDTLRSELESKWSELTRENLCQAFQHALLKARASRDEQRVECATILMSALVRPDISSFNDLCDVSDDNEHDLSDEVCRIE
jgi:hypothetical protein